MKIVISNELIEEIKTAVKDMLSKGETERQLEDFFSNYTVVVGENESKDVWQEFSFAELGLSDQEISEQLKKAKVFLKAKTFV